MRILEVARALNVPSSISQRGLEACRAPVRLPDRRAREIEPSTLAERLAGFNVGVREFARDECSVHEGYEHIRRSSAINKQRVHLTTPRARAHAEQMRAARAPLAQCEQRGGRRRDLIEVRRTNAYLVRRRVPRGERSPLVSGERRWRWYRRTAEVGVEQRGGGAARERRKREHLIGTCQMVLCDSQS